VRLGRLARSWDAVVGSRLARESAPVRLGNGVLVVRASSAAWAAQLRFLAREVAEQVNRVLAGEPVREVKVVVDRASDP
jgi:predicted nucleic acid-binding Zn ribbon protein